MKHSYWLMLLSAFFFITPFFVTSFFLCIFLFPIPLSIVLCKYPLKILPYALFALTIWTIQPLSLYHALFVMAQGPIWMRCILPLVFVSYLTVITASSLFIIHATATQLKTPFMRFCIASCGLFILFMFLEQGCFGKYGGYPFASPLIPLAQWPPLVQQLIALSAPATLCLFFIAAGAIALAISHTSKITAGIAASTLLPWFLAVAFFKPIAQAPSWLSHAGHIPSIITIPSRTDASMMLTWHVAQLLRSYPDLKLILMPESALNVEPDWSLVSRLPTLCIGTFRPAGAERLNLCCLFHESQLDIHTKSHVLPIVEEGDSSPLGSIFFKRSAPPTLAKANYPRPIHLFDSIWGTPCICSELFCRQTAPCSQPKLILALCNDWWFYHAYFKRIMALTGRLRAMAWKTPILFISYSYAQYLAESGQGFPIATTDPHYFIE